ncbi:MAG: DUF5696 domain-containing protein, partial [Acutalibacteraceae bacterium]
RISVKKFRTFCIFLMIAAIMTSLAACSKKEADVTSYSLESNSLSASEAADTKYYTSQTDAKSLKKISSSGTGILYFDEQTYGVSIYDRNSKKLWSSLPSSYRGSQPSVVSVNVTANGKRYTLSSQTDSVAQTGALYEEAEDGVTVNYSFRKSVDSDTRISLTVPVVFKLNQSVLTVSVDCGKIKNADCSDNVFVESISLLNYFGSGHTGSDGDFILVPDGCGALLDTSEPAEKFTPISVPVYSPDYSSGQTDGKYLAKVPCFAVKSGTSAFAAVIENGDGLCSLNVDRAKADNGYNRIGAVFNLTGTSYDKDTKTLSVSNSSYTDEIKISYRFLSGDAANYVGIASACREALTRNGVLNFSSGSEQTGMPLILQLSGSDYDKQSGKLASLTSFNEAQEILSLLRGKGISNMYVRYCGIFSDGPLQSPLSSLKLSSRLGSKKEFNSLLSYASSQNIKIFADANLISGNDIKKSNTASSLDSSASSAAYGSLTSFSDSSLSAELLNPEKIEKSTNSLISFGREMNVDGICISDAGRLLYSDFTAENGYDRQTVQNIIASQCNAVSSSKQLMVDSPSVYTLKYAGAVVNLPDESAAGELESASSVPFLQILLHGLCDYSGKPLNLYKNFESGLLKAVEYGEVPSFSLYYKDLSTDKSSDSYYYMNCATNAQIAYDRMSTVLSGLSQKTITAHYKVQSKVYCTEYGGNISVYVNYRDTDVTVNGVTIAARDFVKVG